MFWDITVAILFVGIAFAWVHLPWDLALPLTFAAVYVISLVPKRDTPL